MPRPGTLDLSKPPFRVPEGQDARAVAEDFIACFQVVSGLPNKVCACLQAALEVAELGEDPLCMAGERIARDMDAGVGAGGANPYHNAQHFCEVVLSALYLSLLAGVSAREKVELLVAALVHDFHHDGNTNANVPFRLERLSAQAASPYLQAAGVPMEAQARVTAMIFSTEVSVGTRFARECHLHFAASGSRPSLSGIPGPLALLAGDARLALQAVIVGEADVLSSAGLTVQYGERQQEKLAEEWKKPLGADHKVRFLNQVFQDFTVGHFFSPNLRALKNAAQERADRERDSEQPRQRPSPSQ
jgi:3'5'-cyclic nucleotide phosphodiesterase family protein